MTFRSLLLRGLIPAGAILLAAVLASLLLGAGDVGPSRALATLLGDGDSDSRFTVFHLRAPRTAVALAVGLALGVAGAVLQAAARNPLAEPGLLGVSTGASFAVVVAIVLGASAASVGPYVAVLGAAAGCLLALGAARLRGAGDDPVRLVLAGAALSGLMNAATAVLLLSDARAADEIRFWTIGSVAGRGTDQLLAVLPVLVVGLALAVAAGPALTALSLGDDVATGLGHKPRRARALAVGAVALLVGAATAIAGPVSFVGLVVPFAARALVGPDLRRLLVVSALLGPAVVLLADVASRLVARPYEMPLGVMTALCGAPVLVAVVRSHRMPAL
ncbi:iron ABC transporter permease [Streptomyces sp. FH025]|uniref:FecCD family ABC transporter permease n=1 Tax=Streptomyces sp. FH025 TaxID=2815937 RepID=UPI001A9D8EB2|nr:iron ABC transporter permease [Streptomyces sp. FH025]MBO1413371.1 iron ABC transporter permease [Streptomyces sp. FH025]